MEYKQIQNIYDANNLTDYKLRNLRDLKAIHGIDYKIDGYDQLKNEHKDIYEKFIINFFNGWGLDARATIVPESINYVKETDTVGKESLDSDCYVSVKFKVEVIGKGTEILTPLFENLYDVEYVGELEEDVSYYLRFQYKMYDAVGWLHVDKETSWW